MDGDCRHWNMLSSPPVTDTTAPVPFLDKARAALRLRTASPAAAAASAERVQRRNQARAERAHRLAVARFGAYYPAGRVATTLHHGGWGA